MNRHKSGGIYLFMRNKIVAGLLFMACFGVSSAYADLDELRGYFEIRDTIKLMNSEMARGLEPNAGPSIYDEDDIEFKIESFISFMKGRVNQYATSDSKLKYHYTKKLVGLLSETSSLFAKAKPIIKEKQKNDKKLPNAASVPIAEAPQAPGNYSTTKHPYFSAIDFRTLASREPLDGEYAPLPQKETKEVVAANEKAGDKKKNETIIFPVVAGATDVVTVENTSDNAKIEVVENKADKISAPKEEKPTVSTTETNKKSKPEVEAIIIKKEEPVADVAQTGSFLRPMAIMVENHNQARPQSGLYKADLVYEMPVEGGITRFMAVFTKTPGLIGPVRSCREYFVDRALEVDALYVHCGGSPKGYDYLSKSKINSIDEIKNSPPFFRDQTRKAPHNLYGKGLGLVKYMSKRISMKVDKQPLLFSYGNRETSGEDLGDYLKINYHGNYTLVIKYEKGAYHRYMNGILHIDRETKEPLSASAVVLQVAAMKTVDSIGRQEISFIGSGPAYILQNGRRTKVTWYKDSPRGKTIYKDANGVEYLFPREGQIWVQVVSPNHKIFFEPVVEKKPEAKKTAAKSTAAVKSASASK